MQTYFRLEHKTISIPQEVKIVRANEYDDLITAQKIITKAGNREQEILEVAASHYEQEKKRGYEEGMLLAQAERAEAVQEITVRYASYVQELETALYDMVSSILTKILEEIPADVLIIGMIKKTLSKYTKQSVLKIIVNSELLTKIEEALKNIVKQHPFIHHLEIVGDMNVAKDKCILETKFEVIELDLQEQLREVVNIMQKLQINPESKLYAIEEVAYG